MPSCYQPQRSWAKVMFLQVSVILGGVCLSACWDTTTPPGPDPPSTEQTPPEQTAPQDQTPPRADTPLEQTPPRADTPPPRQADSGIQSTSGRYASYWNAFLLNLKVHFLSCVIHRCFSSRKPGY